MAGSETLLGVSSVYLFGRVLIDVSITRGLTDLGVPRRGANLFLKKQFDDADNKGDKESGLARIYAFSFEGGLYELARPAIFLVHGPGFDPDEPAPTNVDGLVEYKRLARSPGSSGMTGLGLQRGAFAKDMRVWAYDKSDLSLRLDMDTGTFEQLLLEQEAFADSGALGRSSGATGRSSNATGRSSNSMGRSSGWMTRRFGDGD